MKKISLLLLIPCLSFANTFVVSIDKERHVYDIEDNIPTIPDPNPSPDPSPTIYVVERVKTANGGYTKWSDGYIEQWGRKGAGEDQVVFHTSFTDQNSISFIIQEYNLGDQYGRQPTSLPTITGVYNFNRDDLIGTWMAEGY